MKKIISMAMILVTLTTIATAVIGCRKDEPKDPSAVSSTAPKDHPAH